MRCSACQASLPESAQWCGQCYAPVGAAPTPAYGQPAYGQPAQTYGAPAQTYGAPAPVYGAPQGYDAPMTGAPPQYGPPPTTSAFGSTPPYGLAPAYAASFAPATPKRNQTWLIVIGVLVVFAFLSAGWVVNHRPGPVVTVADVTMRTPDGWTKPSGTESDAVRRQMESVSGSSMTLTDFAGAEKGSHEGAGIATFALSAGLSGEDFANTLRSAQGKTTAGITVQSVRQQYVGTRQATVAVETTGQYNATIVVVPEGATFVMVFVGGDSTAAAADTSWIVSRLTTR